MLLSFNELAYLKDSHVLPGVIDKIKTFVSDLGYDAETRLAHSVLEDGTFTFELSVSMPWRSHESSEQS